MTWSSSLLLMRWAQSGKVVWKQPWGSLGKHLRLKESRLSLVQSNRSINKFTQEVIYKPQAPGLTDGAWWATLEADCQVQSDLKGLKGWPQIEGQE